MKLGILVGVTLEARLLLKTLPGDFPAQILLSGARPEVAERQIRRFADDGITHLLSFGFAGGLDPGLPAGTILLPSAIREMNGSVYHADKAWHAKAREILQPLNPIDRDYLALDHAVADVPQKRALYRRTHTAAVDMESHLVARAGLPFLVLRAICDQAEDRLPPAAMASTREDGTTDLIRLLASIIRQPDQISDLIRLGRSAKKAGESLLRCCNRGAACGFGVG